MKKKQLIIISAVILAVLVVVFAVFAANGSARKAQQNTTVSTSAYTQAKQTTAPTETQETETQTKETTALSSVCSSNGVSLKYQSKSYIQAIGGLAEKDCGGSSGWMYRVNGETPNKGASKYTLSDGDRIEWYYVTNSSDR